MRQNTFFCITILLLLINLQTFKKVSAKIFPEIPNYANNNPTAFQDEMALITRNYKTVDLGLGAPNFMPPPFARQAFIDVVQSMNASAHQYARNEGLPRLVKAIAKLYSPLINRQLDPMDNVVVTIGATGGLFAAITTLTFPDDEWIIFEPNFDRHSWMIKIAGGVVRYVQLQPRKDESGGWSFDRKELIRAFNKKTKGILLNTPHNPTGKVFTLEELKFIAELAIKWDIVVVTDEVYEWLVYDGNQHVRIASLPGMFERTITVSGVTKTLAATGWRIGWAYGPKYLINYLKKANTNANYVNIMPNQEVAAIAIEYLLEEFDDLNSYLVQMPKEMQKKRDFLVKSLVNVGMHPLKTEGGYFILADWTALEAKLDLKQINATSKDFKFVKYLVENVGVSVFPASGFYSEENRHNGENYIRACFIRDNETLMEASKLLTSLNDFKNVTKQNFASQVYSLD